MAKEPTADRGYDIDTMAATVGQLVLSIKPSGGLTVEVHEKYLERNCSVRRA